MRLRFGLVAALFAASVGCERVGKVAAKLSSLVSKPPPPLAAAPTPPPAPPPAPVAPAPVDDGFKHVDVTLHGPLERELSDQPQVSKDVAPALALVMQRISLWWMEPNDARNGDQLRALYQLPAGKEPLVVALRYTSQKFGKTFTAYLYQPPGAQFARYYTADGQELEERLQDSPIAAYEQVTSFLRDGRHHQGVDFKCPVGTPVVAPFNGTLLRKNWNWRGNGNCLELVDDASGRHAKLLHLSVLPDSLKPGMHFKKGQSLAESGNTGHTTAPHLHYQLESSSGTVLDPFKVHATYRASLTADQMDGFRARMAALEHSLASDVHGG